MAEAAAACSCQHVITISLIIIIIKIITKEICFWTPVDSAFVTDSSPHVSSNPHILDLLHVAYLVCPAHRSCISVAVILYYVYSYHQMCIFILFFPLQCLRIAPALALV